MIKISKKEFKKIESSTKKAKEVFKQATGLFEDIKEVIGALDIESPKNILDFKSERAFEDFCRGIPRSTALIYLNTLTRFSFLMRELLQLRKMLPSYTVY